MTEEQFEELLTFLLYSAECFVKGFHPIDFDPNQGRVERAQATMKQLRKKLKDGNMVMVKGDGDRENPSEGLHSAVLVDVVDLGIQELNWQGKVSHERMIQLRFQIGDTLTKGRYAGERFIVSRRFTAKLGKKAGLRKFLEAWAGRAISDEKVKEGFELDTLIGRGAQLMIVHSVSDGNTYANIQNIMPLGKGMVALKPLNYIRVKDRAEEAKSETGQTGFEGYSDRGAVSSDSSSQGHDDEDYDEAHPPPYTDEGVSFEEDELPF